MINLDVHSIYSKKRSTVKIGDLVSKVKELGQNAVALTDDDGLYGAREFYDACLSAKIKPIIGVQLNLVDDVSVKEKSSFSIILLAANIEGYRNLCKLVTRSFSEKYYLKPRVDWKMLNEHAEGVICTLGSSNNPIALPFLQGQIAYANSNAQKLRGIYLENMYAEINPIDKPLYKEYIQFLYSNFPFSCFITNQVRFLDPSHYPHFDLMSTMSNNYFRKTVIYDSPTRYKADTNLYPKPEEELRKIDFGVPDSIVDQFFQESHKIADRIDLSFQKKIFFPKPVEAVNNAKFDSNDHLKFIINEGWKKRRTRIDESKFEDYKQRIRYETEVVTRLGFSDYFIVVADIVNWAKDHSIPVGPGRGSAAGCLLSYILGITEVDPIRYGLIFERFLDPTGQRISPPDIDIDFSSKYRDKVIEYIKERFGEDNVASVGNITTLGFKSAIKDTAKALDIPFEKANEYSKLIPFNVTSLEEAKKVSIIKREIEKNKEFDRLLYFAEGVRGAMKNISTNACGIIVAPEPVVNFCAIEEIHSKGKEDKGRSTQFDKDSCDHMGLLKIDILALTALDTISETKHFVKQRHNIDLDPYDIDLTNLEIYNIIRRGRTAGLFQLESEGMTNLGVEMKVSNLEDVCDLIALYRPQVLGAKLEKTYLSNKFNTFIPGTPEMKMPEVLKELLKSTHGVLVYQEQTMKATVLMAGFSMAEADMMRRATGKKTKEDIPILREKFVAGCVKNGHSEEVAKEVFSIFEDAGYSFNKSHSLAYAIISSQMAHMKTYYPLEFLCASLVFEAYGQADKKYDQVAKLIAEAKRFNFQVARPDINTSECDFCIKDDKIIYGIACIKEISESLAQYLPVLRNEMGGRFKDFNQFLGAMSKKETLIGNKSKLSVLVQVGFFDSLDPNRVKLMEELESACDMIKATIKKGTNSLFDIFTLNAKPKIVKDFSDFRKRDIEQEYLGVSFAD